MDMGKVHPEFFGICADWGDREGYSVTFERDEFEGWYAKIALADWHGDFTVTITQCGRNGVVKNGRDDDDGYREKIYGQIAQACMKARKRRINLLSARAAYSKAA